MYMLDDKWPSIKEVHGIDMSIYKLAICEEKRSTMVSNHSIDHSFNLFFNKSIILIHPCICVNSFYIPTIISEIFVFLFFI